MRNAHVAMNHLAQRRESPVFIFASSISKQSCKGIVRQGIEKRKVIVKKIVRSRRSYKIVNLPSSGIKALADRLRELARVVRLLQKIKSFL